MTEEWIMRCKSGDSVAFEMLVRELSPAIYKLAFSMMGNEHDAKDAVQETFIKVFKALPHFREDCPIKAWVCRICGNTCRDMLRAKSRYRAVSPDDETVFLEIPDTAPSPEDTAITREKQEVVRAAVDALPTEYKLVITLCDLQGLSYMDAAKALCCPLGTLKSRLSRARTLLFKRLSKNQELSPSPKRPVNSEEEHKK